MVVSSLPYEHFQHCRVGFPVATAGTVEARLATYLHPVALQFASSLGAKLEPLEEAVGRHKVGYWRPEPGKWKIRRHREGSGEQRVGSEMASPQRLSEDLPRSSPLCHPVAEWRLASTGWLASGGIWIAAGAMFVG